jgi:uncharacterized OB-fold protein
MSQSPDNQPAWMCGQCNRPLEMAKVDVAYLGNAFPVDLLKCPQCGQVFIPEDLALGKMVEVEKQLEDK